MSTFEKLVHDLAQKSARLDRMLADPHPGLFSWNMMAEKALAETLEASTALAAYVVKINAPKEEDKSDPVLFGG
jgi:hypothetical protein